MVDYVKGEAVIAATNLDSQGETVNREYLELLLNGLPNRVPLFRQHDPSRPTVGWIENFRIEPMKEQPGELALVADATVNSDDYDAVISGGKCGFSYSALAVTHSIRSEQPAECGIYLPYPFYNDEELTEGISRVDGLKVEVGRHIQKSEMPDPVVQIVINTVVNLAVVGACAGIKRLAGKLLALYRERLKSMGARANWMFYVEYGGATCTIMLVATAQGVEPSADQIKKMLDGVRGVLERESRRSGEVSRLFYLVDSTNKIWLEKIEYTNGDIVHIDDDEG